MLKSRTLAAIEFSEVAIRTIGHRGRADAEFSKEL
jgi:hypothetical protein